MADFVALQDDVVARNIAQIVALHNQGVLVRLRVSWRTAARDALEASDVFDWQATIHKVEGVRLFVEYVERAGEYIEIPRVNIEYSRITCRCDPVISGTPIVAEAVRVANVKRPRDDTSEFLELWEAGDHSTPFSRIGSALGGFKIPTTAGQFAIFYPSVWLCKMVAGTAAAIVVSEWKNDVAEWMRSRELDPRSMAAKSELDACREHVADFFKVCEVLLADRKYSLESLPDSLWRMGHHLMESLLKVVVFAKKGPEGVGTLRMKLDSMWAKSKVDYATLFEQIVSIKSTYQPHQERPQHYQGNNYFRSKN